MALRNRYNGGTRDYRIRSNLKCYLLQFAHAYMHDVVCIYIVGLSKLVIKLRSPPKLSSYMSTRAIKNKFGTIVINYDQYSNR